MPKACAGAAVSNPAAAPPRTASAVAVLVCWSTGAATPRSAEGGAATKAVGAVRRSSAQAPKASSKSDGNVERVMTSAAAGAGAAVVWRAKWRKILE
eukprot:CAMPEP_0115253974 /NCGR_PEP_ID=MMETSP0270-20121206/44951_1 /TAXON_ID=71861 /ORGANISM="Scrippsiella trochoidea, Strain CCMP3099" /LENGTH=96 /DNA_ID=CAMNT_0002669501 /DNA_START=192 /DNA_END=479 /DNA_ORIENTATION=-